MRIKVLSGIIVPLVEWVNSAGEDIEGASATANGLDSYGFSDNRSLHGACGKGMAMKGKHIGPCTH